MSTQSSRLSFRGQRIYVGMDVHVNDWTVCILTQQSEHKVFTQPPQAQVLADYLRRNFPGAEYLCAYEAGLSGFWPQRRLEEEGIPCMVVHPVDVPTTGKERRRRNDKRDARKLAKTLRAEDLEPLYVPTVEQEQDRALLRTRRQLVTKQTRCKNQITAQLRYYGIALPDGLRVGRWSGAFIGFLEQLPFAKESGSQALELLLKELHALRALLAEAMGHIRALARTDKYREDVALLRSVPGFSVLSAMIFLTEIMALSRFSTLDRLCSYVGLVPDEDSSGQTVTVTGITRRRNAHLRHILIQGTWTALRKDPVLLLKYEEFASRLTEKRGKAVVGVARKLLSRIRHVLTQREPYEIGLVQ